MNKSELIKVVQKIVEDTGARPDVTEVAVGGSFSSGLTTTVRLGEVETVEFNRDKSIEIMAYKGKSKGSVSITDFTPAAIEQAIDAACRIATYTEDDEYAGLADPQLLAKDFPDLDLEHPAGIKAERAIEYAKECESAALGFDKRITNSEGGIFNTVESHYVYANSNGFVGEYPTTSFSACCIVIADQAGQMQRDYEYTVARDVNDLMSMKNVGIKAAENTLARLGSKPIKTTKAQVLLVPSVATKFWGTLLSAISGGNLYRKRSFLVDKLQSTLLPDFVNITENPHIIKGIGSAPFDGEGVATKAKDIIKSGVLDTYLLSSYSARRLGMQTTGNCGGAHNIMVESGLDDYEQLIKKMNRGLIVTEVMGQGTNMVTGDYSQGAAGFWVENGEIVQAVQEVTIAGNFQDMFKKVLAIGSDKDTRGNIVTGSILLDDMSIAGS